VTVARVVGAPPQASTEATGAALTAGAVLLLTPVAGAAAAAPALTELFDPSTATAVKLLKPWAAMT
jgi:hypothetical protein